MAGRLARYLSMPLGRVLRLPIADALRWYPIACRVAVEERASPTR